MASQLKFGQNLKKLRQGGNKAGVKYTQQQVAEAAKIARSLISEYENGLKEPTLSIVIALADFFGVSLEELCL